MIIYLLVCEILTCIFNGLILTLFHAIFSPIAYTDPLNCNMAGLFTELFKDALNEYAYDAELAGLSYDLMNTVCGMVVSESESVFRVHLESFRFEGANFGLCIICLFVRM